MKTFSKLQKIDYLKSIYELGYEMEKWPNFFIVGAPRAGTTSMYEFLKRTPGVYMSPQKEPHYFSNFNPQYMFGNIIRDERKYLSLFKDAKNEVAIGECSTSYLWDAKSCHLIKNKIPNARIVIMLRNPVQRAFSHYLLRVGGGQTLSFSEIIKIALKAPKEDYYTTIIVNGGFYSEQVKRYLETFSSDRVKIIFFEEFIKYPKKIVKELLKFLGVNGEPPDIIETVHNEFTIPRGKIVTSLMQTKLARKIGEQIPHSLYEPLVKNIMSKKGNKPIIPSEDSLFLEDLYRSDIEKLKVILGRELPWNITKSN